MPWSQQKLCPETMRSEVGGKIQWIRSFESSADVPAAAGVAKERNWLCNFIDNLDRKTSYQTVSLVGVSSQTASDSIAMLHVHVL